MRNQLKLGLAVAAIAVGLVTQSAKAAINNGTFETGNLTGYSTLGDASVQGSDFNPPTGGGVGFVTTRQIAPFGTAPASTNIAALDTAAGLLPGTLEALNVKSGSLLSQSFAGNAGDIITYGYNFLTNEAVAGGNPDFGFVTLKGPTGNATVIPLGNPALATTNPPISASQEGIFNFLNNGTGRETNNQTGALTALGTAGQYTITFGVASVTDTLVDSGLLVDNIAGATGTATGVPLPAAVFLAPLGMAVAARCSKKLRRQQA